jgi:apolipoprotein N-acyltransferase
VFARALGCAALGGVAIGLGGAPHEAFAVAWLGPGLIYAALRALEPGRALDRHALRRASAIGLAAGLGANATTCSWVVELLTTYAFMPTPVAWLLGTLLFVAQSLPFVMAAMLARALRACGAPLGAAWLAGVLVATSASPMIFPWRVGNSQTGFLWLAQLAELGGLPALDLVVVLASVLAVRSVLPRAELPRRAGLAVVAALVLMVPAAWGAHRLDEVRRERVTLPALVIGVVQHDFDIPERHDPLQWDLQMATTLELTREVEAQGVDLVTWPESALPWSISRPQLHRLAWDLDLTGAGVRGPVVFGAGTREGDRAYNSVLAVDRERTLGVVDKTRLMPFSERIPLWELLPFLHPYLGPGLTPGPDAGGTIEVAGARLGILNCYEDLMADHVWRLSRARPELLSNHTNDAWFGRTRAPELHHFLARMRAIETRRDLVRTVNTGVSGLVLSTGETEVRTGVFERTTLRVTVRPSQAVTPWMRFGDRITPLAWAFVLAASLRAARRKADEHARRS